MNVHLNACSDAEHARLVPTVGQLLVDVLVGDSTLTGILQRRTVEPKQQEVHDAAEAFIVAAAIGTLVCALLIAPRIEAVIRIVFLAARVPWGSD
jgi:hypothetical protein